MLFSESLHCNCKQIWFKSWNVTVKKLDKKKITKQNENPQDPEPSLSNEYTQEPTGKA